MLSTEPTATADQIDELLQSGNLTEEEFAVLYRYYHQRLTGYAARRGSLDPEGVANLALFDGYRACLRNPLRSERAFRAYVYRAAESRTIGEHRRPVPTAVALEGFDFVIDDGAEDRANRSWLTSLIEELPNDQQQVIASRYFDDKTAEETGRQLDRKPNAVHQLQHRAVQNLRRVAAAAAFVCLLIAVLITVDRFTSDGTTVLNAPADSSDSTVEQPPIERQDSEPATPQAPTATAPNQTTVAKAEAEAQTDELAAQTTTVPESEPAAETPAGEPSQTTATSFLPPKTSTTVAEPPPQTSTVTVTATAPVNEGQTSVVCLVVPIDQFFNAYIFFEATSAAQADGFNRPESVRFLTLKSLEVAVIDTSVASQSLPEHGSFGWLAIDEANVSRHNTPEAIDGLIGWGVLKDNRVTEDSWLRAQYETLADDGSIGWGPPVNCTP